MPSIQPTAEFPQDADFWALVDLARSDWQQFGLRLRELSTPLVAGFAHMFWGFETTLAERSRELLTSEDAADDLCGWVVGLGKQFYVASLTAPEHLDATSVAAFDRCDEPWTDSAIRYEAERVYHERTGEDLCPFTGLEYDPEESDEYGPLLAARRGGTG